MTVAVVKKTKKVKEDFSDFGVNFQEKLVIVIFYDRVYADQISEVLKLEFFELEYLQVFLKYLLDYRNKYDKHPSVDMMEALLNSKLSEKDELIQIKVMEFFEKIKNEQKISDIEFIKTEALDFAKKQDLKTAMVKSIGLIRSRSFGEIQKLINDSLSKGLDNNLGHDYVEDFEERYTNYNRFPIATGWDEIDKITQGGLGVGELGCGIASTGAGKTFTLIYLAGTSLKSGKNVLFYTLELSDGVIGKRFDSFVTGVKLDELKNHKEHVLEDIKKVPGKLLIKKYPGRFATTQTIDNHIEKCIKTGFTPDMIIVDYADKLKPVKKSKEKRHDLEDIFEELRDIAEKYKLPLWTVSQSNREGAKAELITMESISESYNKMFPCDLIFTLTRTRDERENNTARFFIAKNRFGIDGIIFPSKFDVSKVKIEILPSDAELMDEIQGGIQNRKEKLAKEQQKKLQEKYAKFRKK